MNFTEMEAKVREATNNEPWGMSDSAVYPTTAHHDQVLPRP